MLLLLVLAVKKKKVDKKEKEKRKMMNQNGRNRSSSFIYCWHGQIGSLLEGKKRTKMAEASSLQVTLSVLIFVALIYLFFLLKNIFFLLDKRERSTLKF